MISEASKGVPTTSDHSAKSDAIARTLEALDAIRRGELVILTDDEDRENEGDVCMAAELCTPEAINFMATHARGLICLSLTEERIETLDLPMMVERNSGTRSTAFTVSIEARQGVTTGISAADRARTVQAAVAPDAHPSDIVTPGHIFPLRARPGGVLQRTGHTEGSVDLARLAGLSPAGVICEIMNPDGTMARYNDLLKFAKEHKLCMLSIADLIEYRLTRERLVQPAKHAEIQLQSGKTWKAAAFQVATDGREFLALTHGEVGPEPTLVRVHSLSILGDALGVSAPSRVLMSDAVKTIEAEGRGVILMVPPKLSISDELGFLGGSAGSQAGPDSGEVLREYGLGAQILSNLGLRQIRLLTKKPRRLPSLEGYGLSVIEQTWL